MATFGDGIVVPIRLDIELSIAAHPSTHAPASARTTSASRAAGLDDFEALVGIAHRWIAANAVDLDEPTDSVGNRFLWLAEKAYSEALAAARNES